MTNPNEAVSAERDVTLVTPVGNGVSEGSNKYFLPVSSEGKN
jgi:hypothetical protein